MSDSHSSDSKPENTTDSTPLITVPAPVKQRKRWFARKLLWVPASIVLLLVIAGIAYWKYDVFKSPKQIYLETEFINQTEQFREASKFLSLLSGQGDGIQRVEEKLSWKINADTGEMQSLVNALNDLNIETDTYMDRQNQEWYSKLKLNSKRNELFQLEGYVNKEKMAFSIPTIIKKYISLEFKQFKDLNRKYDLGLPEDAATSQDILNKLAPTQQEAVPFLEKLIEQYLNSLGSENIKLEKNVPYTVADETLSLRKLTITYTEAEFKALLTSMLDVTLKDKSFQSLVHDKYKELINFLPEEERPEDVMSVNEFSDFLEDAYDELIDDLRELELKNGIRMVLWIDGDKQLIARRIEVDLDGENSLSWNAESYEDADKRYDMAEFTIEERNNTDQLFAERLRTYNREGYTEEWEVDISNVLEWGSTMTSKTDGEQTVNEMEFDLTLEGADMVTGTWKGTRSELDHGQKYSDVLTFDADDESIGLSGIELRREGKVTTPDAMAVPVLKDSNTLNPAKASESELEKAVEEFSETFMEYIENNESINEFSELFHE